MQMQMQKQVQVQMLVVVTRTESAHQQLCDQNWQRLLSPDRPLSDSMT